MHNKKIALVVAHNGYQAQEYEVTKKILQEAGYHVATVSSKPGKANAHDGSSTDARITLDKIDPIDYEGIIFIGGPGALDDLDNDLSYRVLQKASMAGRVIGGICSATRILAKAGVLVTKNATGWDEDGQLKEIFDKHAALYQDSDVVTDGHVITAVGPANAEEFAYQILEVL